jgi:hypothetical protein
VNGITSLRLNRRSRPWASIVIVSAVVSLSSSAAATLVNDLTVNHSTVTEQADAVESSASAAGAIQ